MSGLYHDFGERLDAAAEGAKSPYKIIRKEFYVVCECGYSGPAEYDACRKMWRADFFFGGNAV
jgi:hypothetical protein